ncbi:MAG: serine hydrolase domain-containing protein [Chlamydiales bacterium]|nr:serine hydrolase domain-containing protein [Chlamydiales bacterium]
MLKTILAFSFFVLGNYAYASEQVFEDYIVNSMEFWEVPGASIAVVKDNEIILAKGFGHTTLEKRNEVNADTLFQIASLTKSFTSVAAGIFSEQQQISLDSTVLSLWPSFELPDAYATKHLTLRDCLSMRAGLVLPEFHWIWWLKPRLSQANLLQILSNSSFPYDFRGCFAYENLLYNVVSCIIEKNTKETWEVFVQQQILDELGMSSTTTNYRSFSASPNKAFPHEWRGCCVKQVPFPQLDIIAPAAGLSSNANDMAKWLQFLLDKQNSYSSVIKNTLTPQILPKTPMVFPEGEVWLEEVLFPRSHYITYGMGWFIHDYKGVIIFQNPGSTRGMNGLIALVPELNLGIFIASNLKAPFFNRSVLYHAIDHYLTEADDWNHIFLDVLKNSPK